MVQALRESILERLERLPEPALRELLDFAEFLAQKSARQDDLVLQVAGTLSGEPITAEEIERELYGDNAEAA